MNVTEETISAAKAAYWHEVHNGGGYSDKCYAAAIEAAISAGEAVQPVIVKAMEWKSVALVDSYNWLTIAQALTPFGRYTIDKHDGGYLRVMFGNQRVGHFDADLRQETEAAAQADYEQRIMSALVNPQAGKVEAPASERAQQPNADAVIAFDMTDAEILQWIDACNHGPAKASLRHYLALRASTTPAKEGK